LFFRPLGKLQFHLGRPDGHLHELLRPQS
jgi:hypothetical protein